MSTQWAQVFCVRGSVYALNTNTKEWTHRGQSGDIIIFQNPHNHSDVQLKFERQSQQLWWRLSSSKLKPKGDRALVLKAWSTATNQHEILAIRFVDRQSCIQFAKKYHTILQMAISGNGDNTFQKKYPANVPSIASKPPNYRITHRLSRPPPPPQPRRVPPPHVPPRHYQRMPDLQPLHHPPQVPQKVNQFAPDNRRPANLYRPYAHSEPVQPQYRYNQSWKCEVCTYQNQQSLAKCSMCGLPKPQRIERVDDEELYEGPLPLGGARGTHSPFLWECNACTFRNHHWMERCDVCSAKKPLVSPPEAIQPPLYNPIPPKKKPMDAPNKSSWHCPICTLLNDASRARCDACNSARSVSPYPGLMNMGMTLGLQFESRQCEDGSAVHDFVRVASDIAYYNHESAISVFCTLRSVAKKLLKNEELYRCLDTTNPKVRKSLLGFRGVLDFLALLGFGSDAVGAKLICEQQPSEKVVYNALNALNSCIQQLRMDARQKENKTDDGFDELAKDNTEHKMDLLSLEQIIIWATHENMRNNDTMGTLIMTHKLFTDSLTLLKQFRKRFFVAIPPDIKKEANESTRKQMVDEFQTKVQKPIQLKVMNALRDWIKRYWSEDFHGDAKIQTETEQWLKELSVYNQLDSVNAPCVWISAAYSLVHTEYIRQKQINWECKLQQQMNILSSLFQDVEVGDLKDINVCLGKLTAEELADQLTLLDHTLFSRIKPRECIHQRWKDANNKQLAPNILSLIQQFNNFTIFIQYQILRERSLKKRATAIKRIIKMGQHFRAQRNYNSLCAVFGALNAAPINRLKLAWNRVPERYRTAFEQWLQIFCRDFNHRNLRRLLKKAGGTSCIPYIGVFLQDLVGIDEGNKKKVAVAAFNGNQMLNFNKYVRIAERIESIQSFQHHNYYSKIHKNEKIQKILLIEFDHLKSITEDQLWDMSSDSKKQDEREAKQLLSFF